MTGVHGLEDSKGIVITTDTMGLDLRLLRSSTGLPVRIPVSRDSFVLKIVVYKKIPL